MQESFPHFGFGTWLSTWLVGLLVIGVLDGLWLGVVARDLYRGDMGSLMTDQVRAIPAAVFYLGYPAALAALVLMGRPQALWQAAAIAALVGAVAYGTYDMTNLAVIRGWSLRLSLIDWVWGTVVSMVGGSVAWWFAVGRGAAH